MIWKRPACVVFVAASCISYLAASTAGAQTQRDSLEVLQVFGRQIVAESPNMRISLGLAFSDDPAESASRRLSAAAAAAVSPHIALIPVYRTPPATPSERDARRTLVYAFDRNYMVRSLLVTPDSAVLFAVRSYNFRGSRAGQTTQADVRYIFRRGTAGWDVSSVIFDRWTTIDPD